MRVSDFDLQSSAVKNFTVLAVTASILISPFGAQSAAAQALCAGRDELVADLERKFAEVPESMGLSGNGKLFELFSSRDGATWTLVLSDPNGTSCIVAAGKAWLRLPEKNPGFPS